MYVHNNTEHTNDANNDNSSNSSNHSRSNAFRSTGSSRGCSTPPENMSTVTHTTNNI